ncbi:calpain-10 isoform X1 [Ornithorhynchus anatinus]|uniref:Calpain-10 n=1 Tax=Ornithorhynchus anatinus TaxID=9258 RepID=F7FV35_ORNAN|nr:calpain-10 isoform X1 [Ornithorhynchus anatinus]XP_028926073.1 calpain-10 isoform X1 [Ornithorhynchus anatinus]
MLKMPTDGREPFTERQFFKDATFPACDSSIFFNFSTPLAQFRGDISWLRPQEICSNPRLFPENPREGQVKQGILGDCWFLCACAALQKSKHLLDQVIVPGQPSWSDQAYRGRFTCRVWRFGQWTEVTVDDRLPCLGGRLCFSQCQAEDVFWLPLLEKAYAKLHGSYEHLWAGQVADALVDLTGGLAERWTLKETGRSGEKPSGRSSSEKTVFQRLLHLKDQCVISCSVLSSRQGASDLGEFHAFIVSDVRDVCSDSGGRLLLLRIQNPWGRRCWQGAWREGGEGWNRLDSKLASELLSMVQEGEFWVEEEEFVREFDEVTVGYPVTEEGCLQSLYSERAFRHTQKLSGAWVAGQSAGGCRNNSSFPSNPKFWLRVSEPSEVCVALLQRPRRYRTDWAGRIRAPDGVGEGRNREGLPGKEYRAVGLHVWKVEKKRFNLARTLSAPPVAGTACHAYDREVHLRCEFSPGYYLVVPSAFRKDAAAQFLLRVFSTGRVSLSELKLARDSGLAREEVPAGEWETVQLEGSWRSGQTAGGSRNFPSFPSNPCFPLCVAPGPGAQRVQVTLRQHCQDRCHPIGFHIFQVPGSGGRTSEASPWLRGEPLLSCVPHCYDQEVSQLCRLAPGNYGIVPSTYLPDLEGDFTLTIATKIDRKPIKSQETLGQVVQEVSFRAVMKR